jgi:hypothetical protein
MPYFIYWILYSIYFFISEYSYLYLKKKQTNQLNSSEVHVFIVLTQKSYLLISQMTEYNVLELSTKDKT